MAWTKLDDQFFFHPKIVMAGKDPRDLYVASLTYSGGQLTDGFIPLGALKLLGAMALVDDVAACANRLVECGLWEEADDGYVIHDYHDYNPSSAKVKEMREARAEAGRRGGMASASSKTQANGQANEKQKSTPSPSPIATATACAGDEPESEPLCCLASPLAELYRLIERSGTLLNSNTSEVWQTLAEDYGAELVMDCYREAIDQGKAQPPPSYVKAIAARCKEQGVQPGQWKKPRDAPTRPRDRPTPPERLINPLDMTAEEIRANNSRQRRQPTST